jgi:hypothetical protein
MAFVRFPHGLAALATILGPSGGCKIRRFRHGSYQCFPMAFAIVIQRVADQ